MLSAALACCYCFGFGVINRSVIATTLKSLQQRKVLLAVGKVDQYSPTLPYGVLSSAFRTLTLHLLGLPAGEVATWKIRLSRALEGFEELAVSPGAGAEFTP